MANYVKPALHAPHVVTQLLPLSRAQRVRRGLLKGSLAVGFGAACELWAAPKRLPAMHNHDEAQASLTRGRRLLADGNAEEAVSAFSHVLTTAPLDSQPWTGYSLCMKALLGRRDAYIRLGMRKEAGQDGTREFVWGRGLRWPGWYIIAGILLRNELVD